jgi:hypothetical protein
MQDHRTTALALFASIAPALGCGAYRPARFADADPVTAVKDTAPVPLPAYTIIPEWSRYSDAYVKRWLVDGLDPRRISEASDINAFDEVVESSWFAPQRRAALDDYARALPHPPFVKVSDPPLFEKVGLEVVDDQAGNRWQLVHEAPERDRLRTAAGAIASRLMYALGYHASECHVVHLENGERVLAVAWGTARSRLFDGDHGDELGPTVPTGTRLDDPNDTVPHEDRRTLRALALVTDWLGMDEIRPRVLRDIYVGARGAGFVEHQVSGFEDSLGTNAVLSALRRDEARPTRNAWIALATLGFYPKEHGDPNDAPYASVGIFPEHVDPSQHHLSVPFGPADQALIGDIYWIGKRIASMPDSTIAEAVRAGDLESREAEAYVERALMERRSDVGRFAMSFVTPLELDGEAKLSIDASGSRFLAVRLRDASIWAGFAEPTHTKYVVELMDLQGVPVGTTFEVFPTNAKVTVAVPFERLEHRDYLVVRIQSVRDGVPAPRWAEVHLRRHLESEENATDVRIRGLRH